MAFESYRDPDGEIGRKHGDTVISTLRAIYGQPSRRTASRQTC